MHSNSQITYSLTPLMSQLGSQVNSYFINVLDAAEERQANICFFVLGDTSYGEWWVDEVNLEHYETDLILHFGKTCFTQPKRVPAVFILEKYPYWEELKDVWNICLSLIGIWFFKLRECYIWKLSFSCWFRISISVQWGCTQFSKCQKYFKPPIIDRKI